MPDLIPGLNYRVVKAVPFTQMPQKEALAHKFDPSQQIIKKDLLYTSEMFSSIAPVMAGSTCLE